MWINFHLLHISVHLTLVTCLTDLGEVVFVNILFRHGDRTPLDPYPNDPYKNNSLWPTGWGQLTNLGKNGHYQLGKWLRKRYNNLLPKQYSNEDIYVLSTDVDRTLMSAYSNLAGLYEPDLNSNWNSHIKWTPIPVHTVPEALDWVLAGKAPCPKYDTELKKLQNSKEFRKINQENKPLYEYLTKYTGRNVSNIVDVEMIRDTLLIEELHNFSLPEWTKKVYPEPMGRISAFTFSVPCYTKSLARLKIGALLGRMLNHMQSKVSGTMKPNRKAWMYSAHDTTVANVLKALDLFQPHSPPYYSLILIELRKKDKQYFVACPVKTDQETPFYSEWNPNPPLGGQEAVKQIHYRNSSSFPPYFMQLKGCDKLCPFETFKTIVSPLIPQDWKEECREIRLAENIYDTAASISFATILSLVLIVLFSLGVIVKFYKNRRWNQAEFAYKSLKVEIAS